MKEEDFCKQALVDKHFKILFMAIKCIWNNLKELCSMIRRMYQILENPFLNLAHNMFLSKKY